jgi:hypothetical protein
MDIIHQAYTHAHVHDYNNNVNVNDSALSMHNMPIHVRDEIIEFWNELKSIHKNIEEMLVKIETGVENTSTIFDEFILMNEIWVDLKQKRNKIVHDVLACNQDQNSQDILKTWNDIHPQPQYPYLIIDATDINVKHDQKFFDEYVDKNISWDELKQKRIGLVHKLLSQNQDTQIIFQAWMDVFKRYLYLIEIVNNTFVNLDPENSYKLKFIRHVHDV